MGDLEELFFKHGVNVVLAGHVAALVWTVIGR